MMGMDLMHTIGQRGANPLLSFFVHWESPLKLPAAIILALAVPGLLGFVFGFLAFRSRVNRRLSFHHNAGDDVRAHARLLPRRHGLWRQHRPQRLSGHRRLSDRRRRHARRALRADRAGARCHARHDAMDRHLEVRQDPHRDPRCAIAHALRRLSHRPLPDGGLHLLGHASRPCWRALRASTRHHQSKRVRGRKTRSRR